MTECPGHSDGRHIEDWDGSCMGKDCTFRFRSLAAAQAPAVPTGPSAAEAALQHLERQGWLAYMLREADSVKGSEVAGQIRRTVAMCRAAMHHDNNPDGTMPGQERGLRMNRHTGEWE